VLDGFCEKLQLNGLIEIGVCSMVKNLVPQSGGIVK
jgi:hypothetical protein